MRRARLDKALLEKESVTDGQQLLEEDNVLQAIMNEPDLISSLYKTKIKKIKKKKPCILFICYHLTMNYR